MTDGSETVAHCDDVARTYGRGETAVVAVYALGVDVHRNDRIALTGPSGSGKSTVLHLLAGLVAPTTGTVTWPTLADDHRPRSEHIAFVFQGSSLVPALTALENVALPRVIAGHSPTASHAQAAAMLARVGLAFERDRLPEELSAGQQQRVAIARAMVGAPLLILADEPTGQLDRRTADQMLDALVERVDALDAALVVATHDERVARRLSTQWIMRDGRVHEDSPCSV